MVALAINPLQVIPQPDAVLTRGFAGETITAGQAVYFEDDTNAWLKSTAVSTVEASAVNGIALNSAGKRQTVSVQIDGTVSLGVDAAPLAGTLYVLGSTAGSIVPATDVDILWYRTLIGAGAPTNMLLLGFETSGVLPGQILNTELMKSVLTPRQVSDNTAQVGTIIDRDGYNDVTFFLMTGTIADADATFTVLVEHGDISNLSDAAAVADVDLISQSPPTAPETAASWNFGDDNEVRKIGYLGTKRYLRLTVTPALNTTTADFSCFVILGAGPTFPITQTSS